MILEKLGIYGMSGIENAVLAGLVTGDPVLFIGTHGTAKTTLCRRLAEALGLKFFAYDASKALFEDMIGFPNPASISKGEVEYVPTKLSIWDKEFILVDEISRARVEMQNKWLEVIRGRQVMGMRADKLKYIFAAMNPPSYAGAMPLDDALTGRFAFIIKVPEVSEMAEKDVRLVLNNRTAEDAAALGRGEAMVSSEAACALKDFISRASAGIGKAEKKYGQDIDGYLVKLLSFASGNELHIDGRRLGMIKRNMTAYIACFETAGGVAGDFSAMSKLLYEALSFSLPYEAMNAEVPASKLKYIHDLAFEMAPGSGVSYMDFKSAQEAEKITAKEIKAGYPFFRAALTKLIEKVRSRNNFDEKQPYLEALRTLASRVHSGSLPLESNDSERLLEAYRSLYDMSATRNYHYSSLAYLCGMYARGDVDTSPECLMLYKEVYSTMRDDKNDEVNEEKVIKIIRSLKPLTYKRGKK